MSACTVVEHSSAEGPFSLGAFLKHCRMQLPAGIATIGPHERPAIRVGRPVTQEEIAEAIGVSRVWYAMIESGKGGVSPRLLPRIADALMLGVEDRLELLGLVFQMFADTSAAEAS